VCPLCRGKGKKGCSCRTVSANEHLAAEWHEDNPSPATVALGSNTKHKWRCGVEACRHVWEAEPRHRLCKLAMNCPECAKRERPGKSHRKHPSLLDGCPELAAEWDEAKNSILPGEVTCGSKRKAWWMCRVCKWSWQATVHQRALIGTGCPRCH